MRAFLDRGAEPVRVADGAHLAPATPAVLSLGAEAGPAVEDERHQGPETVRRERVAARKCRGRRPGPAIERDAVENSQRHIPTDADLVLAVAEAVDRGADFSLGNRRFLADIPAERGEIRGGEQLPPIVLKPKKRLIPEVVAGPDRQARLPTRPFGPGLVA